MSDKLELSRRKILAGLGTIGVASAGVGLGTSAYFSDRESFENNSLVAGQLDMKVAYSAHYSDWSPDENGSDTETEDDDVDVEMWDGAPNTTGGPGDLPEIDGMTYTGLPTNAAWLIAVDDPDQFLLNTQYASAGSADCVEGVDADDLEQPVIDIEDVKPGDFGEVTFDFALCDNPGYVWLQGELLDAAENGLTEPESKDEDEEDGIVELLDVVQAAAWVDDGNNYQSGDEAPAIVGSLRDVLAELGSDQGLALEGDIPAEEGGGTGRNCFSAQTTHSVAFAWWVPIDHGNEIQTDSASFELGFYTEQCRHNSGEGMATTTDIPTFTGDGFAKVQENFNGDETKSAGARARFGNNGPAGSWELAVGDSPGDPGSFNQANYVWTSGTTVDWEVVYDADADEISFTFDGNSVPAYTLAEQPDGRIAVQGKADEATVEIGDVSLWIDGAAAPLSGPTDLVVTNDGDGRALEYLLVETTLDGESSFTLTGTATVTLQGDYPGGEEDVAFDVVIE